MGKKASAEQPAIRCLPDRTSAGACARYLWAFPNTLIGLILAVPVLLTGGRLEAVQGVLELHGRLAAFALRRCVPLPGGAAAITFGHVVIGRDDYALATTRDHERVHVGQCERWGPLFIPAYLVAAVWGLLACGSAYSGNYFEREACSRSLTASTAPGAGKSDSRWPRARG